jgi:fucose permease
VRPAHVAAFLLFFLLGATTATLGATLPALRELYGLGTAGGSGLVTAYNVGALTAIVGFGFAERFVRARIAISVLWLLFVAGCAAAAFAPQWPVFVACLVVAGFGYGGLVLYLNTAFATGFGRRNVLMVNLLNAVFGAGAITGPLVAGAVTDVRVVLLGIAVLAVPCLLARTCGNPVQPTGEGAPSGPREWKAVLPFALIGFLYSGLETAIGTWESTHLVWTGWSVALAAQLTALFWLGMTLGRSVIPLLTTKVAPIRIVLVGLVVASAALFAATVPAVAPAGYAVAGVAMAPVLPTMLAWMATIVPSAQSANAVVLTACMAANAVHPVVIAAAATRDKPVLIPLVLTGFALACLVAAFAATRPRRAVTATPEPAATTA